ncbi:musculoskeletal embryonic nuclear protein 1a [Takifugu rubripes]|uniref:musculoskeletal embryonic nuclear protein 1a n=1 Tax=Takifugu rubripes TaxID=31033 RepID=UPI0005D1BE3F|nr:musculoskeletal embryonic nuclear protein 1 [Takifugu rubripes]|eukprot:XP_011612077.1 PREDICTED: musculoskeletal embryonic nuclear protein 1 [Takifugu rubripes]
MSDPSQEGDGQLQRPEVRKEDLTQATNKLGLTGPPKSKTIQVMEECERSGTAAPSVFGGRKSGTDTRAAPAVRK